MLRSLQDLEGYTIAATDGDVGEVKDCYFDDEAWVVRYLLVETGSWLSSRKVLISPRSIQQPEWESHNLPTGVDKQHIENSPAIDTDQPIYRHHEMQHVSYYGYSSYWSTTGAQAKELSQSGSDEGQALQQQARQTPLPHQDNDLRLRSCKAIMGYHIKALDGEIGHVESVLINEDTWAVQYLVVNTSNWWLGHCVVIAPEWIDEVSWHDKIISLDLERAAVRASPAYEPSQQLSREGEQSLYDHYERVGYWHRDETIAPK
jgi:uncharacterized protein YrrD